MALVCGVSSVGTICRAALTTPVHACAHALSYLNAQWAVHSSSSSSNSGDVSGCARCVLLMLCVIVYLLLQHVPAHRQRSERRTFEWPPLQQCLQSAIAPLRDVLLDCCTHHSLYSNCTVWLHIALHSIVARKASCTAGIVAMSGYEWLSIAVCCLSPCTRL
jgi:hypothetical protein